MSATSEGIPLKLLLERMEERKKNLSDRKEQRQQEKLNVSAESENSEFIYVSFVQMRDELQKKVDKSYTTEPELLKDHLDSLVTDIQDMQTVLNGSSMFIAPFQVKKAQEMIDCLNDKIQNCIRELQPKKKFGFRKKKEMSGKAKAVKVVDSVDSSDKSINSILEQSIFGFKDQSNETLTKTEEELENRQLNLQDLNNCKVIALGNPGTLQAVNLTDCIVILGPISRSAFINKCKNCTFVMACQQLRIHDTNNCKFYLHVTGAAIIEHCHEVEFAPYNLDYPSLQSHYTKSQLDQSVNYWSEIDDFRWLNENEKSPNFSLISENDRKSDWL